MKQKRTYFQVAWLSFWLAFVTLLAATLSSFAEPAEDEPSLDWGMPGSESNTTLTGDALYALLTGADATAGQTAYLAAEGITLTYNRMVPDSQVTSDYDPDTGMLSLTILPYTYQASNGATVTWIPTGLTVDGRAATMQEQDGIYTCRMTVISAEDFEIQVEYTWQVALSAAAVEEICSTPYRVGSEALQALQAYEAVLADYEAALSDHEAWVAYIEWCEEYDRYCQALAAYTVAKEAYDAYLDRKEAFDREMERVELWEQYYKDAESAAGRLEAYNKYITYLDRLQKVSGKLALMDSIYLTDSRGWNLYASIMGNSVDTVMANQELLIETLKVDAAMVYGAGEATDALRGILPAYNDLRRATYNSEHDRIAALYAFYTEHYEALGREFKKLYTSLKYLYEKEVFVRSTLQSEGKEAHYQQFVGQLYVISTCFDASGERDPNWRLLGKYQLSELVEPVHLIADGDWDPANTAMPQKVAPASPVTIPTPPEGDPPATRPTEPVPVDDPGEEPQAPVPPHGDTIPPEAEHPGDAPEAPPLRACDRLLAEEIRGGVLLPYTGEVHDTVLELTTLLSRPISVENLKTVSFYDHQNNLLERITVPVGGSVFYRIPDRAPTAQYWYQSKEWVTFDGASVDLSNITSDLSLRPEYVSTWRSYTVTWILDDKVETAIISYGTIPVPPISWSLDTKEIGEYRYTFSGWNHEITPVTGDVTYRGSIIESLIHYNVTWVLYDGTHVTEQHPINTVPVFSGSIERPADAYRYTFREWIGYGDPLTRDATYYAAYDRVNLAGGGAGGSALPVTHTDSEVTVSAGSNSIVSFAEAVAFARESGKALTLSWESGYMLRFDAETLGAFANAGGMRALLTVTEEGEKASYRIRLRDAAGNPVTDPDAFPTILLPHSVSEDRKTVFFIEDEEGSTLLTENTLTSGADMTVSRYYAYAFHVTPNKLCNTLNLEPWVTAGERVSLNLGCIFGYEVVGANVVDANGTVIALADDLTFTMPESPVSITLEVAPIRYTVTFMADGEVWSRAEYALGETIVLPSDPTKEAEAGFRYTFGGWGEVPSIASGAERELLFEAQFIKVQEKVDYTSDAKGNRFLWTYLPVLGALLLLVAGVVGFFLLRRNANKKAALAAAVTANAPAVTDMTSSETDPLNTGAPQDRCAEENADENADKNTASSEDN